jgi:Flp pilus assembly protein TadB
MAETLRDGVREIADQIRPSEVDAKLEEAIQNQPLLPHLLALRNVFTAVAIGAVVALLLYLIFSPMVAGLGLIVAFFTAWFVLAVRSHEKEPRAARRERLGDDESDDESGD